MLHKDYIPKVSVAKEKKKTSGHEPHEAWHQDKLIGNKPPVIK
jgi:hypothetical protein